MDDRKVRRDILDELEYDPSLDAAQIGVAVEHRIATLTGHMETYTQKLTAEKISLRVRGVRAVASEIEIRWPGDKRHADDEIAARALDIIS
jgi:osmotically-inducible protein OsmY